MASRSQSRSGVTRLPTQSGAPFELPEWYNKPDRTPVIYAGDVLVDPAEDRFFWVTREGGEQVEYELSRHQVDVHGAGNHVGVGREWDISEGRMGRVASGADTLVDAHLVLSARTTTGYDRNAVRNAAEVGHISVDDCYLTRLRDQTRVGRFLEHPVVDHVRGSVEGWLACFGLEYGGDLVATVVLENPYNPVRDNGAEVYLSRYAAHPYRPPNSASYLISRAREWCRVNGYSIISTNAGISGDNFGTIYQSAGFQYLETVEANGSGWKDARGGNRDEWEDYRKRRHRYEIGSGLRRYTPKTAKFYEKATALSAFEDTEPARAAESHVAWIEPGRTETKGGPLVGVRERFDLDAEVLVDALVQTEAPTVVLAGEQQSHLRAVAVGSRLDEETLRVENVLVDDEAVKWPTNYGAWLIGQLRTWATLEGYNRVVSCNPRRTQAAAILARAGFERVDETLDLWAAQIE